MPAAKRDDALRYFHDVAATVHAVARASPELAAAMTEGDERASTDDTKGKAPGVLEGSPSIERVRLRPRGRDGPRRERDDPHARRERARERREGGGDGERRARRRQGTLLRGANEGTCEKNDPIRTIGRRVSSETTPRRSRRSGNPSRHRSEAPRRALARFGATPSSPRGVCLSSSTSREPEEGPETSDETSKPDGGGGGGGSNRSRAFAPPPPLPSSGLGPAGAFVRKKGGFAEAAAMRRGDGGFLLGAEALDGEAREAAKRAILDTEYDDEYDDSYDELAEVRGVAESKPAGDEEGTSAIAGGVQATGGRGGPAGGRGPAGAGGGTGGQGGGGGGGGGDASSAGFGSFGTRPP